MVMNAMKSTTRNQKLKDAYIALDEEAGQGLGHGEELL